MAKMHFLLCRDHLMLHFTIILITHALNIRDEKGDLHCRSNIYSMTNKLLFGKHYTWIEEYAVYIDRLISMHPKIIFLKSIYSYYIRTICYNMYIILLKNANDYFISDANILCKSSNSTQFLTNIESCNPKGFNLRL